VFPGQGSQYVGMGAALIERSPTAAAVLDRADAALEFPLSRLILQGPAEELDLTVNAQPAILATSVAFLEAMREEARAAGVDLNPHLMAGHSAGQYAAAVAAEAIDFESALHLVRERGRIMQERGIEGGMGAVYQAWDAELGVAVAIKVIRPEAMADQTIAADIERRFKRELLLASLWRSPERWTVPD